MGERDIHGLQTFFFADMDYRGFSDSVPGMLAADFDFEVSWPSQSGADARIDPFSEGTPEARGKRRLSLNWCDPAPPVSRPTGTAAWSRRLFRRFSGGDVGPLAGERVPEVLVRVTRGGEPVPRACVARGSAAGAGGPAPRRAGGPAGHGVGSCCPRRGVTASCAGARAWTWRPGGSRSGRRGDTATCRRWTCVLSEGGGSA